MKIFKKKEKPECKPDELMELYFASIRERQKLQNDYYDTGNKELLPKIQDARKKSLEIFAKLGDDKPETGSIS